MFSRTSVSCKTLPGSQLSSRLKYNQRKLCINTGLFCFSILKQVRLFLLKFLYEFVWTVLPQEHSVPRGEATTIFKMLQMGV